MESGEKKDAKLHVLLSLIIFSKRQSVLYILILQVKEISIMAKKSYKQLQDDLARLACEMEAVKAQQKELRKKDVEKLEKRFGKICVSAFGANFLLNKSDEELNKFCDNFKADLADYEFHEGDAQNDAVSTADLQKSNEESEDNKDDFDSEDDSKDDVPIASVKNSHTPYNPAMNRTFGL